MRPRGPCPEVLVVGAGPHALTCVLSLLAADRALAGRIAVADPQPWLHAWREQLARLDLRLLRSACVHHPHPAPYALLDAAAATGREAELVGPIGRPGTALFADFCAGLVDHHDLEAARLPAAVTSLRPRDDGRVDVEVDGQTLRVRHVVLANNPSRPAVPALGMTHADGVDLRLRPVGPGDRVCVVGGGLTAAHLALRAREQGADSTLISRTALRERPTDVDPVWLGHALPTWFLLPPAVRATSSREARLGSVPTEAVDDMTAAGVRHVVGAVEQVRRRPSGVHLRLRGSAELVADHVWLATGHAFDVRFDPLTAGLLARAPLEVVDGLPLLDDDLSWAGTAVHVTGGLAALQVGPAARNLVGARLAAERMVGCLTGQAPTSLQYPSPVRPCPLDVSSARPTGRGHPLLSPT